MPRSRRTAWQDTKDDLLPYVRRLIVTIIIVALALLLWELKEIVLLAFASVLVAIALLAAAGLVNRVTGFGHRTSLAIGGLLSLAILAGTWVVAWPSIQTQIPALMEQLSASVTQLEEQFNIELPGTTEELAQAASGFIDTLWNGVLGVAQAVIGGLSTFLLVIVAGVFIAGTPRTYREGLVLLFPKTWHAKIRRAMEETGTGLHLWLRAQGLGMLLIGIMTGLGAWAIGLPAPLALGLIAGLTEFVPIIGPFIGAVPALLVAFSLGGNEIVWTIVLYVFVQQVESNFMMPVLQRRIVSIPPVVILFSFVALGVIFGIPGILVAAPLTIVMYVLIREFYIAEMLEERAELEKIAEEDTLDPTAAITAEPAPEPKPAEPEPAKVKPAEVKPAEPVAVVPEGKKTAARARRKPTDVPT